jgi:hypothetical protein
VLLPCCVILCLQGQTSTHCMTPIDKIREIERERELRKEVVCLPQLDKIIGMTGAEGWLGCLTQSEPSCYNNTAGLTGAGFRQAQYHTQPPLHHDLGVVPGVPRDLLLVCHLYLLSSSVSPPRRCCCSHEDATAWDELGPLSYAASLGTQYGKLCSRLKRRSLRSKLL